MSSIIQGPNTSDSSSGAAVTQEPATQENQTQTVTALAQMGEGTQTSPSYDFLYNDATGSAGGAVDAAQAGIRDPEAARMAMVLMGYGLGGAGGATATTSATTSALLSTGVHFDDTAAVGADTSNATATAALPASAADVDGYLPKAVALVSGNDLGLTGSSLDRLGSQGVLGATARTTSGESLYVNTATGNLVVQRTDELLVGLGPDAQVLRTYNSQAQLDGDNNDNWRIGFYRQITALTGTVNAAGSSVVRVEADGSQRTYTFDGTHYVNQDGTGAHDTLSYSAGTATWTWTDGDSRVRETYSAFASGAVGRLLSTQDIDGNTVAYAYDNAGLLTQVTTANTTGQQLNQTELVYDAAENRRGNLLELKTTAWNAQTGSNQVLTRTRYSYDSDNRLERVTTDLSPEDNSVAATGSGSPNDGKTYSTSYTYDGSSKRIASITESNRARVTFQYDALGRVTQFTEGGGRTTRLSYDGTAAAAAVSPAPAGTYTVQAADLAAANPWAAITQTLFSTQDEAAVAALRAAVGNPPALSLGQQLSPPASLSYQTSQSATANLTATHLQTTAPAWGAVTSMESGSATTKWPQVAFGANGDGLTVWVQGTDLLASTYSKASNTWSAPVAIDGNLQNDPRLPHLSVSANGNMLVTWFQVHNGVNNVSARRFVNGAWDATASTIPALAPGLTPNFSSGAISDSGRATVVFLLFDPASGRYDMVANTFNGSSWQASPVNLDDKGTVNDTSATYTVLPRVAMDAAGNATAVWVQPSVGETAASLQMSRFSVATGQWSTPSSTTIEGASADVTNLRIASAANGDSVIAWRHGGLMYAKNYTASTGQWGPHVWMSDAAQGEPSLSVSANGNAILSWTNGSNQGVYARCYVNGAWTAHEVISDPSATLAYASTASINNNGQAVIAFNQNIGTGERVFARTFSGGSWQTATQMESTGYASLLVSQAAIDAIGNVQVVWPQVTMPEGNFSLFGRRYSMGETYYLVPSGATWSSVAQQLYGSGSDATVTALKLALNLPSSAALPAAGTRLQNLPGSLNVTETVTQQATLNAQAVTVPARLVVQNIVTPTPEWKPVTALETGSVAAYGPQVAYAPNGDGLSVWTQGPDLMAATYSKTSGTWSTPIAIDGGTADDPVLPHLSASSNGNMLVTWKQGTNIYARRYVAGAWDSGPTLLSNGLVGGAYYSTGAISDSGKATVVFAGSDGYRWNAVANVFNGSTWQASPVQVDDVGGANNNSVTSDQYPRVAMDAAGNATMTWVQAVQGETAASLFVSRYNAATGTWATPSATLLENTGVDVKTFQIAFDNQGNGLAAWIQGTTLYTKSFTAASQQWGLTYGQSSSAKGEISLSMSGNGHAVLAIVSGSPSGSDGYIYARRYADGAWLKDGFDLLSNATLATARAPNASINDQGQAVVTFMETDSSGERIFAQRQQGGTWSGITQIEAAGGINRKPVASIDATGNVQVVWSQQTAEATAQGGMPSMYARRFENASQPYYQIPTGATWASVAQALYGSGSEATVSALKQALNLAPGAALPAAGTRLQNLPSSLNVTAPAVNTQAVTVPAHFNTALPAGASAVVITDPLGQQTQVISDAKGRLIEVRGPQVDGASQVTRYQYDDATGQLRSHTDASGQTTTYEYDAHGNQTLVRDAAGNTTTRTYGQLNQLLTQTRYAVADPDGAGSAQPSQAETTRYVYNSQNKLRYTISAEGRVSEYRWGTSGNERGQQVAAIQYSRDLFTAGGTVTEAAMDAWVNSSLVDKTSAIRVDSRYDFRGQLSSSTRYERLDASGNGIADSSASTTHHVYDAAGQLLKSIESSGGPFTAPAPGALPSGTVTQYAYDGLSRVYRFTDALGVATLTQYDDANNRVTTLLANGLSTTRSYNRIGEMTGSVQAASTVPGNALSATVQHFDAAGRLRQSQDALGYRSYAVYDAAGRQVASIEADGTLVETRYNAANQAVQTIRYANAVGNSQLAALQADIAARTNNVTLAQLRPAADASRDRSTFSLYDEAGRLAKTVDELGFVSELRYDGASRIASTVRYATALSSQQQNDLAQNILSASPTAAYASVTANPGEDRASRNFYDRDGRLSASLDAAGVLSENFYDGAGRLVHTVTYATPAPAALWAAGTLAQLRPQNSVANSAQDSHQWFFYDAKSQRVGELNAEGVLTEHRFDERGNKVQSTRYANLALIDPAQVSAGTTLAQLRPAPSTAAGSSPSHQDQTTRWTYTALNQASTQVDPQGTVTRYTYDNVGQLIQTDKALGALDAQGRSEQRTLSSRYDLQGRVVGELTAEGSAALVALWANAGASPTASQVDAVWRQYGLTHSIDAAGRRTATEDQNGAVTRFFYNSDGRLVYTVNALGEVTENRYNVLGELTHSIQYANRLDINALAAASPQSWKSGNAHHATVRAAVMGLANTSLDSVRRYAYDRRGQLAASLDALSNITLNAYNAFGQQVAQTQNIDGTRSTTTRTQYDQRGLKRSTTVDAGGLNITTQTHYDAFGRVIEQTDALGHSSRFEYDRLGRVVQTIDRGNVSRATTYDAFDRVLTQRDGNGHTTRYQYDQHARSLTVTTAEGIQTVSTQNRHGQTIAVQDGRGNTTSYQYDKNGQLLSQTQDQLGSATQNAYDRAGRLIEVTDARGTKTRLDYDAVGRVLTRTVDPSGLALVTRYTYDAKGQQVGMLDANGVLSQTEYDLNGQAVRITQDVGGLNLQTQYRYDAQGRTLVATDAQGIQTHYTYDNAGRRIEEVLDPSSAGHTGLNLTRRYEYDAAGNLTRSIDAGGNATTYAYDHEQRLVYTVDAMGGTQRQDHDREGRVVKVTRYAQAINTAGLESGFTLGGAGSPAGMDRLAQITGRVSVSNQDAVEHRVLDNDGRLRATVNEVSGGQEGEVTTYRLDANGNVVERRAYAARVSIAGAGSGAWTPASLPLPVADDSRDQRVSTVYDAANRATHQIDATGAVVKQVFDANGNVTERIAYARTVDPQTPLQAADLDNATAVIADSGRDARTQQVYDAVGRLQWRMDGAGAVTQMAYDEVGNLIKTVQYATALNASADLRTAVQSGGVAQSGADRATDLVYDRANRQTYSIDALGQVNQFVHDAAGRVTQQIAHARTVSPPSAGLGFSLGGGAGVNQYRQGNIESALGGAVAVTADADPGNRVTRFAYDAAGRQVFMVDAEQSVTEQRFDARGAVIQTIRHAAAINTGGLLATAGEQDVRVRLAADPAGHNRVQTQGYDAAGRLTLSVDGKGHATYHQLDALGRVTATTRHHDPVTVDAAGTVSGLSTHSQDRTDHFEYDQAGRLVRSVDALQKAEVFSYDGLGRKTSFTNKNGATWTYQYDAAGRLTQETSPQVQLGTTIVVGGTLRQGVQQTQGIVTRLEYDALGNLVSRTDAVGRPEQRQVRYAYDALGRQTRTLLPTVDIHDPDPTRDKLTPTSSPLARIEFEKSASLFTETFYDAFGNAVAQRDTAGHLNYKTYDKLGRLAFDIDALGHITRHDRNAFGEETTLTRYARASGQLAGGTGLPLTLSTDHVRAIADSLRSGEDRQLRTEYDALGRAVRVIEPETFVFDSGSNTYATVGKTTTNRYDAMGDLVQVLTTQGAGQTTAAQNFYYDERGQQVASVDALGYLTTQRFDDAGNLLERTEYAQALQGWQGAAANGGAVPQPPQSSSQDRTTRWDYDAAGRKIRETQVGAHRESQAGSTIEVVSDLVTHFGYDGVGNLIRIQDAAGGLTYNWYDALGRTLAVAAPRTVLDSQTNAQATPLITYRRDAFGNVLSQTEHAQGAVDGADETTAADALAKAPGDVDDRTSLTLYNNQGQAIQNTDALGINRYVSYNALGKAAKEWQALSGNQIAVQTAFRLYDYDALGRLIGTVEPGANLGVMASNLVLQAQRYNAFGEVVSRGTNAREQDVFFDAAAGHWRMGAHKSEADSGAQEWFRYDAAGRLLATNAEGGQVTFYLYDAQGNRTAQIQSAGVGRGNLDLQGYLDINLDLNDPRLTGIQAVAALKDVRRTDYVRDALGRVIEERQPERVVAAQEAAAAQAGGSAAPQLPDAPLPALSGSAGTPSPAPAPSPGFVVGGGNVTPAPAVNTAAFGNPPAGGNASAHASGAVSTAAALALMGYASVPAPAPIPATSELDAAIQQAQQKADAAATQVSYAFTTRHYTGSASNHAQLSLQTWNQMRAEHLQLHGSLDASTGWSESDYQSIAAQVPLKAAEAAAADQVYQQAMIEAQNAQIALNALLEAKAAATAPAPAYIAVFGGGGVPAPTPAIASHQAFVVGGGNATAAPAPATGEARVQAASASASQPDSALNLGAVAAAAIGQAVAALTVGRSMGAQLVLPPRQRPQEQWDTIKAVWRNEQHNPAAIMQAMAQYGVDAADLAFATGLTLNQIGTYLLSNGAADGFAGWTAAQGYVGSGTVATSGVKHTIEQMGNLLRVLDWGTPQWDTASTRQMYLWAKEFGWTLDEIGAAFGFFTGQQIREHFAKYGYNLSAVPRALTPEAPRHTVAEIGDYLRSLDWGKPEWDTPSTAQAYAWAKQYGWTLQEIGDSLGFTAQQMREHFAKYGYTLIAVPRTLTPQAPRHTVAEIGGYLRSLDWGKPEWDTPSTAQAYAWAKQYGWTLQEIGDSLGFTAQQMREHFAKYGYTLPTDRIIALKGPDQAAPLLSSAPPPDASAPRLAAPTVQRQYDRWGNLILITDPRSAQYQTTFKYNAQNKVVQQTTVDQTSAESINRTLATTRVQYDRLGREVATTDALGHVQAKRYNATGQLLQELHADGSVEHHGYNAFGNEVSRTDGKGNTTELLLDKLGRVNAIVRAAVEVDTVSRDSGNNLVVNNIGPQRHSKRYTVDLQEWDELGRKLAQTEGLLASAKPALSSLASARHDALDPLRQDNAVLTVSEATAAMGLDTSQARTTRFTYDLRGNLMQTRNALGQGNQVLYDNQDQKIQEKDANGRANTWQRDYFGQVSEHSTDAVTPGNDVRAVVTADQGTTIRYTYDNARQLVRQQEDVWSANLTGQYTAKGEDGKVVLDAQGNPQRIVSARQSTRYQYDAAGQLTRINDDANGQVSLYDYDLAGHRTLELTTHDGAAYQGNENRYDHLGRLVQVESINSFAIGTDPGTDWQNQPVNFDAKTYQLFNPDIYAAWKQDNRGMGLEEFAAWHRGMYGAGEPSRITGAAVAVQGYELGQRYHHIAYVWTQLSELRNDKPYPTGPMAMAAYLQRNRITLGELAQAIGIVQNGQVPSREWIKDYFENRYKSQSNGQSNSIADYDYDIEFAKMAAPEREETSQARKDSLRLLMQANLLRPQTLSRIMLEFRVRPEELAAANGISLQQLQLYFRNHGLSASQYDFAQRAEVFNPDVSQRVQDLIVTCITQGNAHALAQLMVDLRLTTQDIALAAAPTREILPSLVDLLMKNNGIGRSQYDITYRSIPDTFLLDLDHATGGGDVAGRMNPGNSIQTITARHLDAQGFASTQRAAPGQVGNQPQAIAAMMLQYGVTAAELATAHGVEVQVVRDYFARFGIDAVNYDPASLPSNLSGRGAGTSGLLSAEKPELTAAMARQFMKDARNAAAGPAAIPPAQSHDQRLQNIATTWLRISGPRQEAATGPRAMAAYLVRHHVSVEELRQAVEIAQGSGAGSVTESAVRGYFEANGWGIGVSRIEYDVAFIASEQARVAREAEAAISNNPAYSGNSSVDTPLPPPTPEQAADRARSDSLYGLLASFVPATGGSGGAIRMAEPADAHALAVYMLKYRISLQELEAASRRIPAHYEETRHNSGTPLHYPPFGAAGLSQTQLRDWFAQAGLQQSQYDYTQRAEAFDWPELAQAARVQHDIRAFIVNNDGQGLARYMREFDLSTQDIALSAAPMREIDAGLVDLFMSNHGIPKAQYDIRYRAVENPLPGGWAGHLAGKPLPLPTAVGAGGRYGGGGYLATPAGKHPTASVQIDYDLVGNRTRIATQVNHTVTSPGINDGADVQEQHFVYDAMNRQVGVNLNRATADALRSMVAAGGGVLDSMAVHESLRQALNGADPNGVRLDEDSHVLTYDRAGNRESDTQRGRKLVSSTGIAGLAVQADQVITERYEFDAQNRLVALTRDDVKQEDARRTTQPVDPSDDRRNILEAGGDGEGGEGGADGADGSTGGANADGSPDGGFNGTTGVDGENDGTAGTAAPDADANDGHTGGGDPMPQVTSPAYYDGVRPAVEFDGRVNATAFALERRRYDALGQVVEVGPHQAIAGQTLGLLYGFDANGNINAGMGDDTVRSEYDLLGRMVRQQTWSHVKGRSGGYDYKATSAITYQAGDQVAAGTPKDAQGQQYQNGFDAAGNLLQYTVKNLLAPNDGGLTTYRNGYVYRDGYLQTTTLGYRQDNTRNFEGTRTTTASGSLLKTYDANGHLTSIIDPNNKDSGDTRYFVTDAAGNVLRVWQVKKPQDPTQNEQFQLVANGQVMGRYGEMVDPDAPRDSGGTLRFIADQDFNFVYQAMGEGAAQGASTYTVVQGDTLQSIAKATLGDAGLWALIAEANAIADSAQLTQGQVLRIPGVVRGSTNNEGSFVAHDPTEVIGSSLPYIPQPKPKKDKWYRSFDPFNGRNPLDHLRDLASGDLNAAFHSAPEQLQWTTKALLRPSIDNINMAFHYMPGQAYVDQEIASNRDLYAIGRTAATVVGSVFTWYAGGYGGALAGAAWDAYYGWYNTGSANDGARQAAPSLAAAAVTWGMSGYASPVVSAMVSNAVQQGVSVAMGQQEDIDFRGIAAAGAVSYLGGKIGVPDFSTGFSWGKLAEAYVKNVGVNLVGSAIQGDSMSSGRTLGQAFLGAASSTASQWASGKSQQAAKAQSSALTQQITQGTDAKSQVARLLIANGMSPAEALQHAAPLAAELEADGLNSLATAGGSDDGVKRPRWQPTSAAQRGAYANALAQLIPPAEALPVAAAAGAPEPMSPTVPDAVLDKASNVAMLVAIKERVEGLRTDMSTNRELYLTNNPEALRQMEAFGPVFDRALLGKDVYFNRSIPELMPRDTSRVEGDAALGKFGMTAAALNGTLADGYFAALYQTKDASGNTRLIYVNRGTDDMGGDIIANLEQGRGKETPQYEQAITNARSLKLSGFNVEYVGHSLGGGLAMAQALVTDSKATVFNSAAVHPNTISRWGRDFSRASELVTAYNLNGDALSFVQDGGKLVLADAARQGLPFFGRLVGGAAGGLVGNAAGQWTAKELANMPAVQGNRYKFPASEAPVQVGNTFTYGNTFTNEQTYKLPAMVRQHFMDTMIYSMASRMNLLKWGN